MILKIIKNNYSESQRLTCENCQSVVEADPCDIKDGEWRCPCCGYLNGSLPKNLDFPCGFYHYGQSSESKRIEDATLSEWVKKCVNSLDESRDYCVTSCGDSIVFAFKDEEDITVIVARNYYETII